ncbi:MAG: Crp/Fnr family transcriptional regulator [Candidatus Saccharimonadales bacterium]
MSSNFKPQLLSNFFHQGKPLNYSDGDLIYESSSSQQSTFCIEEGFVKSYKITDQGETNILSLYGVGYIFPLIPTFRSQLGRSGYHVRGAIYYEAICDSVIYKKSGKELFEFSDKNHDAYKELSISLLNNSEIYLSRIGALHFKLAKDKLIYQLLVLANLFSHKSGTGKVIDIPLTHQDIGDILGLARETVSREMEKLKANNLIAYQGKHIEIIDVDKLEEILPD